MHTEPTPAGRVRAYLDALDTMGVNVDREGLHTIVAGPDAERHTLRASDLRALLARFVSDPCDVALGLRLLARRVADTTDPRDDTLSAADLATVAARIEGLLDDADATEAAYQARHAAAGYELVPDPAVPLLRRAAMFLRHPVYMPGDPVRVHGLALVVAVADEGETVVAADWRDPERKGTAHVRSVRLDLDPRPAR